MRKKLATISLLGLTCSLQGQVNPVYTVANTLLGEARGEGLKGLSHIADVIHERSKRSGKPPVDVVTAPKQFDGVKYRPKSYDSPEGRKAIELAKMLENGIDPLPDVEYTHFYSGTKVPVWAKRAKKTKIGNHFFVRLEK